MIFFGEKSTNFFLSYLQVQIDTHTFILGQSKSLNVQITYIKSFCFIFWMYDFIFEVSEHQNKILKTQKISKNTLNLAGFTTEFR